jgi:hypothetical protein
VGSEAQTLCWDTGSENAQAGEEADSHSLLSCGKLKKLSDRPQMPFFSNLCHALKK